MYKNDSVQNKFKPSETIREQSCCWICLHSEEPNEKGQTKCHESFQLEKFQPCLCRGSMSYVHKDCLDIWVKQKYTYHQSVYKEKGCSSSNVLPPVFCPNCKHQYKYTVKESRTFSYPKYIGIRVRPLEAICLLVVELFQLILLGIDDKLSKMTHGPLGPKAFNEQAIIKMTSSMHIAIAGLILLTLFCSMFQIYTDEIKIEVLDKDAVAPNPNLITRSKRFSRVFRLRYLIQ